MSLPQFTASAVDFYNGGLSLGVPVSMDYHSILTRPYDELTLWVKAVPNQLKSVSLLCGGQPFFEGIVLSQVHEETLNGALLRLECRSRAGYMMEENEINPYTYFKVTAQDIVRDYAMPYGIVGLRANTNESIARMLVSERQSYWDYLIVFFMRAYGKLPYVTRDNYIALTPYSGRTLVVSNTMEGGLPYLDYADRFKIQMTSKVWCYTGEDDWGGLYEESYTNPVAATYGSKKEVYVDPPRAWVIDHPRYANYLFYKSMVDSRGIEVSMPDAPDIHVGDSALFENRGMMIGNLYVGEKRIQTTKDGVTTTVSLWDKQFNLL